MAETKKIIHDWNDTGITFYTILTRDSDSFIFDASSGTFVSSATGTNSPYLSLTEDAIVKGRYTVTESRDTWADGLYYASIYEQSGGTPSPVADNIRGTADSYIRNDLEIVLNYDVSSIAIEINSMNTQLSSMSTQLSSISTQVDSVSTQVGSIGIQVGSISWKIDQVFNEVTTSANTIVDLTNVTESMPRIERLDTFQFIKSFGTVPNSAGIEIYFAPGDASSNTIVATGTATQSGTTANYYYYYTDSGSNYTTVDSSGFHFIRWTAYRSTGNDIIKDYFEIIRTD